MEDYEQLRLIQETIADLKKALVSFENDKRPADNVTTASTMVRTARTLRTERTLRTARTLRTVCTVCVYSCFSVTISPTLFTISLTLLL